MRKKCILLILLSAITLSGCGNKSTHQPQGNVIAETDTATESDEETEMDSSIEPEEETKTDSPAEPEEETDSPAESEDEDSSDESASESPEIKKDPAVNITIEMQNENNSISAEDGTILYKSHCIYPVISIEDNNTAAEKINADIRARLDAFYADTEVRDWAKESYQFHIEDEDRNYSFVYFQEDLWIGIARSDRNVISIVLDCYTYAGGAHGSTSYTGINYSTKTGEQIAFSDLGEDADSFYADTFAYNLELAMTDYYQEKIFDFVSDSLEETIENVLYNNENRWYLSTDGIVFISNEYELGAYVYGAIDFFIPYSELEKMGLKEEYAAPQF